MCLQVHVLRFTRTPTIKRQLLSLKLRLTLSIPRLPSIRHSILFHHGVQYVGIPQFESVGQSISELMSSVVAGKTSVTQALQQSDQLLSSQVNKDNASGY